MSRQNYLKITYHGGSSDKFKINTYLNMPSPIFNVLLREIQMCIFDQHQQLKTELRIYWIDEDKDEIEIVNQCDYEIFMSKCSGRLHIHASPRRASSETDKADNKATAPENAHPNAKSIHQRIECDGCNMSPIIGFRYKCIQCANFDLCENCEMNHKHPEHMMVRMPNQNSPDVIETWFTGRGSSRRHHKYNTSASGTCPFQFSVDMSSPGANSRTPKTGSGDGNKTPGDGGKEHHHGKHGRKQQRRNIQNNIFTHLYNMMQDLAEGGGPSLNEDLNNDANKNAKEAAAKEAAIRAASAATASAAASIAADAATHAATQAATQAATHGAFSFPTESAPLQAAKNTGTIPKTPPSTPNETKNESKQAQTSVSDTGAASSAGEDKEYGADTTGTTQILNSPIFENVAQYMDPQYMKAGIQILNNFSEMFAKMLDPVEGEKNGDSGTRYQFPGAAFNQQRKNSSSSTASSTQATTTKTSSNTQDNVQPEIQTQSADSLNVEGKVGGITKTDTIKLAESEKNSLEMTPPESRRSQSEETDWQIIDKNPLQIESLVDITTPAAETPKTLIRAPNVQAINYVQLSKDLQAHIDQENEKDKQASSADAAASPSASSPAGAPLATSSASGTSPLATPSDIRVTPVYHKNRRINDAVIALMEMGFVNENNALVELLESVNGNIDQALEMLNLMSH